MSALDDAMRLAKQVPPTPPKTPIREQHDPRNEANFKQLLRETLAALQGSGIKPTPAWLRISGGWDETKALEPVAPAWPLRIFALGTDSVAWPYIPVKYEPKMMNSREDFPGFGPGSDGLWVEQEGFHLPGERGLAFRDNIRYDEEGRPWYRPPTSGWTSYQLKDGFMERLAVHPNWDGTRLPLVDAIALGISEL